MTTRTFELAFAFMNMNNLTVRINAVYVLKRKVFFSGFSVYLRT